MTKTSTTGLLELCHSALKFSAATFHPFCGKPPAVPATIVATASNKAPFPGRYNGNPARCELCPFRSHVFFGDSMNKASIAISGSPSRAAVIATIGKSHPQVSAQRHSANTLRSVRRIVSGSTPSPGNSPYAPSIDG
ncbi:hypothetical protein SBA4_5220006 [Candidatus Sulfopaludibacter sp. SbA4]|nr:hypothetical protein SBA4_5220006 [Candidatus Sulfopaludibacter sp. SbA4]